MKHYYEAEGAQERTDRPERTNLYTLAVAVLVGLVLGVLVMLPARAQTLPPLDLTMCDTAEQARRFVELAQKYPDRDVNHVAAMVGEEFGNPASCGLVPQVKVKLEAIADKFTLKGTVYRIVKVEVLAIGFQPIAVPTTQYILMRIPGPPEREA